MKVRGAIFSMLESRGIVWGAERVLDLFAGSGSLGFEALSRGALEAWFVERERPAADCIRRSAEAFGLPPERCRVLEQDVAVLIRRPPLFPFSLIFIDPPYGAGRLAPTVKNVVKNGWLAPDGFLLAEVEAQLPLQSESLSPGLSLEVNRTYGQTRILLWQQTNA